MDDDVDESKIEVWVEKPKRIIHNQALIQFLNILAIMVPLPLALAVFWSVFVPLPSIVIPAILVVDGVGLIIFGALGVYIKVREWRAKRHNEDM